MNTALQIISGQLAPGALRGALDTCHTATKSASARVPRSVDDAARDDFSRAGPDAFARCMTSDDLASRKAPLSVNRSSSKSAVLRIQPLRSHSARTAAYPAETNPANPLEEIS